MSDIGNLIDRLSEPFPVNAIEYREGGGGRQLAYVATETVIRRLNRVAPAWDFRITEIRERGNWLIVWGELTIEPLGTRAGTGVQVLVDKPGAEDMVKGAASDCLKKCASLFGVGIDLYGPDLEAGELPAQQKLPTRARTTSVNTISASDPIGTENTVNDWTEFWRRVEAFGLPRDKKALEKQIGSDLGVNPAFAIEKVQAYVHDTATQRALS